MKTKEKVAFVGLPDETHEAMRDLVRARDSAAQDQRHKRQLISAVLLRHGRLLSHQTLDNALPTLVAATIL
jgi:transposase